LAVLPYFEQLVREVFKVKEKKSGKVEKKESKVLYDPVSDTYYELYNYPLV